MKTLKQHRRERALSIRDLAEKAGVSHQTIVSGEAGKPLRLISMRRIAEALGVRPMEVREFAGVLGGGDADSGID
jgi:DNA-binding XRE family transcriptional regulator